MIQRFTRAEFEAALPKIKNTSQPLWSLIGLIDGEHCYAVPVRPGVIIFVRSSIRSDGLAADVAADSIRCWLASGPDGKALSSKNARWITRVNGWEARLTSTLRVLWRLGSKLEICPTCGDMMHALKSKSEANTGRWYRKCLTCNRFDRWLPDPNKESKSK